MLFPCNFHRSTEYWSCASMFCLSVFTIASDLRQWRTTVRCAIFRWRCASVYSGMLSIFGIGKVSWLSTYFRTVFICGWSFFFLCCCCCCCFIPFLFISCLYKFLHSLLFFFFVVVVVRLNLYLFLWWVLLLLLVFHFLFCIRLAVCALEGVLFSPFIDLLREQQRSSSHFMMFASKACTTFDW